MFKEKCFVFDFVHTLGVKYLKVETSPVCLSSSFQRHNVDERIKYFSFYVL